MPLNIRKLATQLAPAYNSARDSEVEDDVTLCEWVRRQTSGTEITLRQAERLREAMEEIDAAGPVKVIIFVEGGVVQGCTSNDPKLEVILVDRDSLEDEDSDETEDEIVDAHPDCTHDVF